MKISVEVPRPVNITPRTTVVELGNDWLLDQLIEEAQKDRDDCHVRGIGSIDTRRALAHVVTRLQEARGWRQAANEYYEKR